MNITREVFGELKGGEDVYLYTLVNSTNTKVQITNFGGIIVSLETPDRDGKLDNVVLGFDNLDEYLKDHPYFGALIGRYGNRIGEGKFSLNGKEYQLSINDGDNHLHGGKKGFDKVLWNSEVLPDQSLKLTYLSKDGEEGYPGNLKVSVVYRLTEENELQIDFEATTDQATPINLTAHSYFNLRGDFSQSILDHQLKLNAKHFTPVTEQLIPTGKVESVKNTPFDFTGFNGVGTRIEKVVGGYDHNFVLDKTYGKLTPAAEIFESETGRKLTVYTTEPAIQFYSGNFLDGTFSDRNGVPLEKHSGFCLEPQHYPDSPNIEEFPSTILQPDETYTSKIVYLFTTI